MPGTWPAALSFAGLKAAFQGLWGRWSGSGGF